MRTAIAFPLLLLLGACEANVSDANDTVTLEYDENLAADAAGDISNGAQEIGGHIVNDVQGAAGEIENRADDVSVDVDADVSTDEPAEAQ